MACLLKELEYDLILPGEYTFVLDGLSPPYGSIMKTVTSVSPASFYNGGLSFFAAPELKSGSFAERSLGSTPLPNIQLGERCRFDILICSRSERGEILFRSLRIAKISSEDWKTGQPVTFRICSSENPHSCVKTLGTASYKSCEKLGNKRDVLADVIRIEVKSMQTVAVAMQEGDSNFGAFLKMVEGMN